MLCRGTGTAGQGSPEASRDSLAAGLDVTINLPWSRKRASFDVDFDTTGGGRELWPGGNPGITAREVKVEANVLGFRR